MRGRQIVKDLHSATLIGLDPPADIDASWDNRQRAALQHLLLSELVMILRTALANTLNQCVPLHAICNHRTIVGCCIQAFDTVWQLQIYNF